MQNLSQILGFVSLGGLGSNLFFFCHKPKKSNMKKRGGKYMPGDSIRDLFGMVK